MIFFINYSHLIIFKSNYLIIIDDILDPQTDSENKASVKLEVKRLAAILTIHSLPFDSSCLCKFNHMIKKINSNFIFNNITIDITDNEALVLNIILSPSNVGNVTFYLSVASRNDFDYED